MKIEIIIDTAVDTAPAILRLSSSLLVLAGSTGPMTASEVQTRQAVYDAEKLPEVNAAVDAAKAEMLAPMVEAAKRTRRTKAEMEAAAAPAPEQQTELPVEEPAPAPAEPAPAPAATPAAAVPDFAAVKAAAVDLVNKHGGEIQSALTKFISVQFKDADGNPARLFTLTDDGRAKTMATVQACAALADKDAILKHLAV